MAEDATYAGALARWEGEVAAARRNCAARALDDTSPFMGARVTLRWIYTHMIGEYARHCGHADLIRERVDGRTGFDLLLDLDPDLDLDQDPGFGGASPGSER